MAPTFTLLTCDGVDAGPGLEEVPHEVEVALLAGLHQGRGGAQLEVGAGLDEEVGHLEEAAAAGQGERRLLRLVSLGVDVSSWEG